MVPAMRTAGTFLIHAAALSIWGLSLLLSPALAAIPGKVVAWGWNISGQTTIPAGLSGVTAIAGGNGHTVALKSDGTAVAWGWNIFGQTTLPAGLSEVTAIAAGSSHTVALKSNGTVVAWGNNYYGQTTIPAGLTGVTAIAAGGEQTVALKSDGTVVAWGDNAQGQTTIPAGLSGVTSIAGGSSHTVALKSDGTVVAWGYNGFDQTTIPAGLSRVTAIAAGDSHTVALYQTVAPNITVQPLSAAASVGQLVTFTVTAAGVGPLAYLWRKDGADLSTATNAVLTLSNVQTNQAGAYAVVITNAAGSLTSSVATLSVSRLVQSINFGALANKRADDPPFTLGATNSSGLPVNFSSSDPAVATLGGNSVTLVGVGSTTITASHDGNSTFQPAVVSRNLTVSGAPPAIAGQPVNRSINTTSNTTFSTSVTGTAPLNYQWFGLTPSLSGATGTAIVAGGFVFAAQLASGGTGYVQAPAVRLVGGGGSGATATATVINGAVVALIIDSAGSGYTSAPSVQIDPPNGFLASQTNATLTLTNVGTNDAGTYFVVVTNAYGSVTSSPATLTVSVPAAITQQPQGIVTAFGSNATFTVGASGTLPLSYQWYWQPGISRTALAASDVRNGFVVGAAVLYGGGYYSSAPAVQILGGGTGASATATVNNGVVTAVNILAAGSGYPSNAVVQIDPPVAGTTRLLTGQTAASLSLAGLGALASGSYFVVVTNAGGSVTSSPAVLRVLVPQRFAQPPERLGDGSFRLRFVAHDGTYLLTNDLATLELWGSTNLANPSAWLRLTNGITVQNGQVQVDDADSPGLPRRFYRVITR